MIDKLSDALAALLPAELAGELRDNIDAVLRANLEKMNLVTRDQFEIQEKILHRTRSRVGELERQVAELEKLQAAAGGGKVEEKPEEKPGEKSEEKPDENAVKSQNSRPE